MVDKWISVEAVASIQAAAEMADEYATTETGVIEFGECPP